MKNFTHVMLGLCLLFLAGCNCDPKPSFTLDVTLRPQQTSMWCWAASGQMCMEYLGVNQSQCTQANNEFSRNDCCNTPKPNDCVNGGWPEFDKYGFSFTRTSNTALTWDQIKSEIYCNKRPFAFSWHWPGGGGHMMTAIGYVELNGDRQVLVNNPWAPNVGNTSFMSYDWYVAGAGDHTHWDDFYQIVKK